MRSATGTAPRQRHSPRVRRLADEHGVELERLTGTGPLGRVVSGDVLRAAHLRAPHQDSPRTRRPSVDPAPPPPVAAGGSAPVAASSPVATVVHESVVLEVDATGLQSRDLLVRLVGAAVAAVRTSGGGAGSSVGSPEVDVALHRHGAAGGSVVVITAAHDLNADALASAAAGTAGPAPDTASAPMAGARSASLVAVHDLTGLGLRSGVIAPGPGELVALTIGAPTTRVAAVDADGGTGTGLRVVADVTLSWDRTQLPTTRALALVRDLGTGLEHHVAGRAR